MARVLVQSTNVSGLVYGQKHSQSQRSGKSKGGIRMMYCVQTPALRIRSLAGLGGSNALHTMTGCQDFHSRVAISLSRPQRGKKTRHVVKAMFERFTEKAIKVIMLAQEEALMLRRNSVGTELLLLGLIDEGTGIAAKVLKSMGINLEDARVEVEKIIGRGSGFVAVEIPFTPRAKRVLELSLEEACQLSHDYVGSEHLLLGLLCEGEGIAARVLENLGADPSNIRAQVIRMVGESTEDDGAGVGGGTSGNKMPTLEEYKTLARISSALRTMRGCQDFHSRVAISLSRPQRGMNTRHVVKATFDRFTDKAIKVIMLAQKEALMLRRNSVGTELLLLGLIDEGTGIAAKVLKSMGINLEDARVEVEKIIGRGSGFVAVEIPFTPRAKRVCVDLSPEEARQLSHDYIGSEHLLLGLLREGEGIAARVLENLGADPSNIRAQVIRMVGESTEADGDGVGGGTGD